MLFATKVLNVFSALVILMTGAYVMVTFGDILGRQSKLVIGAAVLAYAVAQTSRAFRIRTGEEASPKLSTRRRQLFP